MPPTATTVATTTTVPGLPPTQVLVGVSEGILGCRFEPSPATVGVGSTVQFRNNAERSVAISIVAPPGADGQTISLDSAGTSGPYSLAVPGTYRMTCTAGGDGGSVR